MSSDLPASCQVSGGDGCGVRGDGLVVFGPEDSGGRVGINFHTELHRVMEER